MGWVKATRLDNRGNKNDVVFDSRLVDLNQRQKLMIHEIDTQLLATNSLKERDELLARREVLLQGWTGWPRAEPQDERENFAPKYWER